MKGQFRDEVAVARVVIGRVAVEGIQPVGAGRLVARTKGLGKGGGGWGEVVV